MAKKIQTLYRELQELAKSGKFRGRFTLNQAQIRKLEEEGFMIIYSSKMQLNKEGPKRVTVSWEDPSIGGDPKVVKKAKELYDLAFRKKQKSKTVKRTVNKIRQINERIKTKSEFE